MQANAWAGFFFCYIAIAAIYYSNTWNVSAISLHPYSNSSFFFQSKSFPMLSTSLFSSNGSIYDQMAVFTGAHFQLNQTALKEVGLPALTGSNAWAGLMGSIAIGGLIAHCIFFWGPSVVSSFKHARDKTQPDPHWVAMQKYDEAPRRWYVILLLLAFFAGECTRYLLFLPQHLRYRFRLRRSYQRAQRRDDAASVVVHRSSHLWCDCGPVLDTSLCSYGERNRHQSALQDARGRHQPWEAGCESLRGLFQCPVPVLILTEASYS